MKSWFLEVLQATVGTIWSMSKTVVELGGQRTQKTNARETAEAWLGETLAVRDNAALPSKWCLSDGFLTEDFMCPAPLGFSKSVPSFSTTFFHFPHKETDALKDLIMTQPSNHQSGWWQQKLDIWGYLRCMYVCGGLLTGPLGRLRSFCCCYVSSCILGWCSSLPSAMYHNN